MTPRRSTRLRTLDTIANDITRCLQPVDDGQTTAALLTHAITRLNNARPGHPAATTYDSSTGSHTAASRPPPGWGQPDIAQQLTTEIDHLLRTLMRDAHRLRDLVEGWAPRQPSSKARTATTTAGDEPGCTWCATIPGPAGLAPWWQPIHRTTTLNGTLEQPTPLCHACIRRHADTGRKPTRDELLTKRDTERWPHTHDTPRKTG